MSTCHLSSTLILTTLTYQRYYMTNLQASLLEVTLSADTIDIGLTRVILDVDVAIRGISHLSDDTSQAILGVADRSCEEVGNATLHNSALLLDNSLRS